MANRLVYIVIIYQWQCTKNTYTEKGFESEKDFANQCLQ